MQCEWTTSSAVLSRSGTSVLPRVRASRRSARKCMADRVPIRRRNCPLADQSAPTLRVITRNAVLRAPPGAKAMPRARPRTLPIGIDGGSGRRVQPSAQECVTPTRIKSTSEIRTGAMRAGRPSKIPAPLSKLQRSRHHLLHPLVRIVGSTARDLLATAKQKTILPSMASVAMT